MILFRHADPRLPFLSETADQPDARWHRRGDGPTQYFADTPDGAWAEFLRHEEIRSASELEGVERALWAVEVPGVPDVGPNLPLKVASGDIGSYAACQAEGQRLRRRGDPGITVRSAALPKHEARGRRVDLGLKPGPNRDGHVIVLFGAQPHLVGWKAVDRGAPPADLLARVRHFV